MATIFDKAKQLATKITDEINKDKWDSNCINTALFNDQPYTKIPDKPAVADGPDINVIPFSDKGSAAPAFDPLGGNDRPKVKETSIPPVVPSAPASQPAPAPASNTGYVKPVFKSRFGGPGGSGYSTSKVPNSGGLRSLSDLPVVDRSQAISSIGTMEANRLLAEQAEKEKQAQAAKAAEPVEAATPAPAKEEPEVNAAATAASTNECCYYVLVKHTKTFPAVGSCVMMRMCDSKYVWTDEAGEDQKPKYKICPNCGKRAGYTETEMD